MSLLEEFRRVDRRHACPICGKPDWCLVSRDAPADPARVICKRIESSTIWGEAGHLHVRRGRGAECRAPHARRRELFPGRIAEIESVHARALAQVSTRLRQTIATRLGVSPESLMHLGMGSLGPVDLEPHGLFGIGSVTTFPMRAPGGGIVGLRLRKIDGRKLAIPGSRNALFIPTELSRPISRLLIAEGESDTTALLDLGYDVIGRPGCSNGAELVVGFVRRAGVRDVVVVMDGDADGRRHGVALARRVRAHAPTVRAIEPPPGIKDARAWTNAGATRDVVDALIAATPRIHISVNEPRAEVVL